MNNVEKIKKEVLQIIDETEDIGKKIEEAKSWSSLSDIIANISSFTSLLFGIIDSIEMATENIFNELKSLKSEEKRKTAVAILDDLIKLPWYLEFFDGPILEVIISVLVDVVNKRNEK